MEAEREALTDNDDEATSGHMEIVTLLEQSVLLIDQVFIAKTYYKRLNIVNTFIN